MILDKIKEHLKESRQIILEGGVNCIPSPFIRYRVQFPGVRKKFYYLVSGATKSSKTQITNYIFIINSIFYYLEHPNQIKPTIHMFPLEETREDISLRFYSYVLNYITNGKYTLSPEDLESVDERKPLSQEVLDIMDSDRFINIIKVFEECVIFHEERNATGIYKTVKSYLEEHGKSEYEEVEVTFKNSEGYPVTEKTKRFKKYIPNNPNEYVIFIVDHVGLLQTEYINGKTQTLKDAIEKLSEYCVILRNRYSAIPVIVQQQNSETTNLDAFKSNKIRPTKDGLKDSKRTGEDCTVLFGITNPSAFELSNYQGYNINILKDSFRVLEIVLARKGRANGLCPLFFNGAINSYAELPSPKDPLIEEVYKKIKEKASILMLCYSNKKNNRNNIKLWNKIHNFVTHFKKTI